jgi:hypothetical protein
VAEKKKRRLPNTGSELRAIARELGIKDYARMSKVKAKEAIREHDSKQESKNEENG